MKNVQKGTTKVAAIGMIILPLLLTAAMLWLLIKTGLRIYQLSLTPLLRSEELVYRIVSY